MCVAAVMVVESEVGCDGDVVARMVAWLDGRDPSRVGRGDESAEHAMAMLQPRESLLLADLETEAD